MKKLTVFLAVAMLLCCVFSAGAEVITDVAITETALLRYSLTTGLASEHEDRTMVAQMDNEPGARPQKGIASADIVYESETYNGGYTRYTAVFNDTIPKEIEAIRSTRMVHVDLFKEYGGAFIHYGAQYKSGSNAEQYLEQVGYGARYDGIKGIAGFYRDSSRKAPNNVVCKLKDLYDKTDWTDVVCTSPLRFSETGYTQQGESVAEFGIEYRKSSYCPSYSFRDGLYYRSYNGKPQKDGTTGEPLAYANVIVQRAAYSWYNGDGDRPIVELFGTNTCDYFINGMHFTGYWERSDVDSNTRYYDDAGNEVLFMPGKTFIQILKEGKEIDYAG